MSRLSKSQKEKIVDNAIKKAGYPSKFEVLQQLEFAISENIRVYLLGGAKKASEIEKVCEEFLQATATFPSGVVAAPFTILGGVRVSKLNLYLRFEKSSISPSGYFYESEDSELYKMAEDFLDQRTKLYDEQSILKREVSQVLSALNTDKQLLNLWPEAEELLDGVLDAKMNNLPVIQVTGLNAKLGLPTVS